MVEAFQDTGLFQSSAAGDAILTAMLPGLRGLVLLVPLLGAQTVRGASEPGEMRGR